MINILLKLACIDMKWLNIKTADSIQAHLK